MLFLQESAVTVQYRGSLEEALCDVIACTTEMMDLNEALFVADYQLHTELQEATEGEAAEKKEGFLKRAWGKIKEGAKKLLGYLRNAIMAVRNVINKVLAKFGSDSRVAPKGTRRLLDLVQKYLQAGLSALNGLMGKLKALCDAGRTRLMKADFAEKKEAYTKGVAEAKQEVLGKLKAEIEKAKGDLQAGDSSEVFTAGDVKKLQASIAAAEKDAASVQAEINGLPDDSEGAAGAQAALTFVSGFFSSYVSYANFVLGKMAGKPKEEKK